MITWQTHSTSLRYTLLYLGLLLNDNFFFFYFILFIYFLSVLGLRCRVRAFSTCVERGLLFVEVRGLLVAVASLVAEHGF